MKKASSAFNAAKFQWCLQLCDALIETENLLAEAKVISTYRYSTYLSIGAAVYKHDLVHQCMIYLPFYINKFQKLKIQCLRKLAEGEISANGRNYYLTSALVEEQGIKATQNKRYCAYM